MHFKIAHLLACCFGFGICTACGPEAEEPTRRASRSARYADGGGEPAARDVSQRPEGSRAADVVTSTGTVAAPSNRSQSAFEQPAPSGPPETTDADVLEAAVLRRADWTPLGTRAQAIRCQAAVGEAAVVFTPSWYAYADQANPDTPVQGCERGASDSMLEALPRGVGRTALCAIGWRAVVRPGAAYPYAGMGVRTAGSMGDVEAIWIETRSSGKSFEIRAQLNLEDQEFFECGDPRKAPYEQRLRCDGTGEWVRWRLPVAGFKPAYGKPDALDPGRVVSLHFQNAPGHEGPLECDVRIGGVE